MKILSFFLAFNILLLPFVPCNDVPECVSDSTIELTNSTNHQHEEESCNPFCICDCCGQIFYSHIEHSKTLLIQPFNNSKKQFFYNNILLSANYLGNIWQPPKYS